MAERDVTVPISMRIGEFIASAKSAALAIAAQAAIPPHYETDMPCFYCTLPEGHDACPVHRDHP